jgi:hypothetical protein
MRKIAFESHGSFTVPRNRQDIAWGMMPTCPKGASMSYQEQHNADQTVTVTWWCRGVIEERHAPSGSRPANCTLPPWVDEPALERHVIRRPTPEDRARMRRERELNEYNDEITRGGLDPESVSFEQWRVLEFRRRVMPRAQDKDDGSER